MLEQDYIKDSAYNFPDERSKALNEYSSQLIRELIIPGLTREVNSSRRYASLRQVYYSLILSRWFKLRFSGKTGIYASLIDTKNLTGLTSKQAWSKSEYFEQYRKSFADGEYSVKETVRTPSGQAIRSYFSGGIKMDGGTINVQNGIFSRFDRAAKLGEILQGAAAIDPASINLAKADGGQQAAEDLIVWNDIDGLRDLLRKSTVTLGTMILMSPAITTDIGYSPGSYRGFPGFDPAFKAVTQAAFLGKRIDVLELVIERLTQVIGEIKNKGKSDFATDEEYERHKGLSLVLISDIRKEISSIQGLINDLKVDKVDGFGNDGGSPAGNMHFFSGSMFMLTGRYDSAVKAFDKAIQQQPDSGICYLGRGTAKGNLGRYQEAIDDLTEAIRLLKEEFGVQGEAARDSLANAFQLRGNIYKAIGQPDKAEVDFAKSRSLRYDGGVVATKVDPNAPEIMFFGGSAVSFYKEIKGFRLLHAIAPIDGGLTYDGDKNLLNRIMDNPSSSGALRAFAQEDLPAFGDITKVIIESAAKKPGVPEYISDILEARFTSENVNYHSMEGSGEVASFATRFKSFSEAIDFIAINYRMDNRRAGYHSDSAWENNYRTFINSLRDYASEVDKINPAFFSVFIEQKGPQGQHLRHSVKNLVFYAILRQNDYNFDKALNEFSALAGGGDAALQQAMLTSYHLNRTELVAELENGSYLCGQEEFTQNLFGSPVKNFFFASREEIRAYLSRGRQGEIKPADVLPIANQNLLNRIDAFNKRNQEAKEKSFIVFGPGSQFSSVLVNLKVPGVIRALANAKDTPRVLVLNPIWDYETSGMKDEEYFGMVIDQIEKAITAELKEGDISTIFDFIVFNDSSKNSNLVKSRSKTDPLLQNNRDFQESRRGKQRRGLIKYNIKDIRDSLKGKSVVLVTGNLLETANDKVTYSVSKMEALFGAMQKFYVQRHQTAVNEKMTGGILLTSDLHATVNSALRFKLAFPDAPLVVIGDPSDRGHNLYRLLRLIDSFVIGDHELWAVAMASGLSDSMTSMYLRMAFNYENDDLLEVLNLQKILEKTAGQDILTDWKAIGYISEKNSASQKAGKFFQYFFTKTYYEAMCNEFSKTSAERDAIYEKVAKVLAHTYNPRKRIFRLEGSLEQSLDALFAAQSSADLDNLVALYKARKEADGKSGQEKDLAVAAIASHSGLAVETRLTRDIYGILKQLMPQRLELMTRQEREFLQEIKDIIAQGQGGKNNPSALRALVSHFLKAPIFRNIRRGPQVPRISELFGVQFIDPNADKDMLVMHALPPLKEDGSTFVDMLGNDLKKEQLKEYYTKLDAALQDVRKVFLKGGSFANMKPLFAGYDPATGNEITLPASEWFVRLADMKYGPLMAREHRRIESEYVNKLDSEPDNLIYDLLYKGKVKDLSMQANLKAYFSLSDSDFKVDPNTNAITLKESGQEKIVKSILTAFKEGEDEPDMLIVGHKRKEKNQLVFMANGKLAVLDVEAADRGGKTGALDNTQYGGALLVAEGDRRIVLKLLNIRQVFARNQADFIKPIKFTKDKEDKYFNQLDENSAITGYYQLSEIKKSVITSCNLRDVQYEDYNMSISLEDIREAFNNARLDTVRKNSRGEYTLVGELVLFLNEINWGKVPLNTFDELFRELRRLGVEEINAKTVEELINRLPPRSALRDIKQDRPHEFLLPLFIGEEYNGSKKFTLVRIDDKAGSIAYNAQEADSILDKISPSIKARMENNGVTFDNDDFSNGSMLDESKDGGAAPSAPGGIDFRGLPMNIQPMGSFSGMDFNLPQLSQAELDRIDVAKEVSRLRGLVRCGSVPSDERVTGLVAACVQKRGEGAQLEEILLCLSDILKLEEENAQETSPEIRKALAIADSQS
ncbi:MAG: 2-phospho-L-lactate transferase CofD family protein [Deltaproteobacteria bacterium]